MRLQFISAIFSARIILKGAKKKKKKRIASHHVSVAAFSHSSVSNHRSWFFSDRTSHSVGKLSETRSSLVSLRHCSIFHKHRRALCVSVIIRSAVWGEIYEVALRPLLQKLDSLVAERNPDLFRCLVSAGCQLTLAKAQRVNKAHL